MRIDKTEITQHGAAGALLVLFIFWFMQHSEPIIFGVFAWSFPLVFLYLPNLFAIFKFPEKDLKDMKKTLIAGSWFFGVYSLHKLFEDTLLMYLGIVLLIIFIIVTIYYQIQFKKRHPEKWIIKPTEPEAERKWKIFQKNALIVLISITVTLGILLIVFRWSELIMYFLPILLWSTILLLYLYGRRLMAGDQEN